MFTNRKKAEFLEKEFVWFWAGLAFQAGYVNAAGFLACARFVSHMTGFGTQVGMSLSEMDYMLALEMLSAPASFLVGAMVSGLAVDRPVLQGRGPKYLHVMSGIVLIYVLVAIGGVTGFFGTFGEPLRLARDFALMDLLCFVCGMQNACFSSLTRGQIRTTHLTGLLTDIGTTTIKLFYIRNNHREAIILLRTNRVRAITFLSFSFGSAVSAVVMSRVGYGGFAVLVATSLTLLLAMLVKARRRRAIRMALMLDKINASTPGLPIEEARAAAISAIREEKIRARQAK